MSNLQRKSHLNAAQSASRTALAIVVALGCVYGFWHARLIGLSRVQSAHAQTTGQLEAADRAVQLYPANPDAHFARASILAQQGRLNEASASYERLTSLLPRYYFGWLQLGYTRDMAGDRRGALAAYKEAMRFAPYYAPSHWYLGHLLLRLEQYDEAFAEFRRAATSDPTYLPDILDTAWQIYGDAASVEQVIRPLTPEARLSLAGYFAKVGATEEAMQLFRDTKDRSDESSQAFLTELLNARQFPAAYEVWANRSVTKEDMGLLIDGSFENKLHRNNSGFGWRLGAVGEVVRLYTDSKEARDGSRSIRVDFDGDSDPSPRILSQLVLVEPHTRYRLSWVARTQDVATMGLPLIYVTDASGDVRPMSPPIVLPTATTGWQNYALDFLTTDSTTAVLIIMNRQVCSTASCPIYGHIWLDGFSLKEL